MRITNLCPKCKTNIKVISKNGKKAPYCRECNNAECAKWRNNFTITRLISYAKNRAKKYNLEFTIKKEDLVLPEKCPILDIFLDTKPKGKAMPNSCSLHRLDSSKGYIKNNVIICSWRANNLIGDAVLDELIKITEYYKKLNESRN